MGLRVPVSENRKQRPGRVHGGVVSRAAGRVRTLAGGGARGPARVVPGDRTSDLQAAIAGMLIARTQHPGSGGAGEALRAAARDPIGALPDPSLVAA